MKLVSAGAVGVLLVVVISVASFLYLLPTPDAPIIDSAPPPMPEWSSANRVSVAGAPHYTRHDGKLKPVAEMDIESGDWSYLKAETKDAVTLQIAGDVLTIPKANTVFIYAEDKISPVVTYTKKELKAIETDIDGTWAYITFPYTMNSEPVYMTNTTLCFDKLRFDAGNEHIRVYDSADIFLNGSNYDFKIVGTEIRLYYDKAAIVKASGDLTFEMCSWSVNSGIISGLVNAADSHPAIFQMGGVWYLITGRTYGTWQGYNWTGSAWQSDSAIISGLTDVGYRSTPDVFQMGGTWHLISGDDTGTWEAYHWTGSTWTTNNTIITGLADTGANSAGETFQMDGTWYRITSCHQVGTHRGYNWTGSAWQSDSAIISGLINKYRLAPSVFQKDGTWNMVHGDLYGVFYGYNWTGSAWQSDSAIISGLTDVGGISKPCVFQMDSTWYVIVGSEGGVWKGWNLPVPTTYTPPDPTNLQHTTSVGWVNYTWSAGSGNVTDSYNVLHNDVWSNGSANAYLNSEVGGGNWSNITVYAYNTSGGGTLSAGSVSDQNVAPGPAAPAIPPDPTTLTNTTGNFWVNHTWSAGTGNVTDSYRVRQNGIWHNSTTNPHYNATTVGAHGYSDITVYAYNASSSGTLSAGSITQNTTLPNNPITITNTAGWSGIPGANVPVDYDATDADGDAPTFSCNRTDLFSDFSTATGVGNWVFTSGTLYVNFGVSDGYGSVSNYTMVITEDVASKPPSPVNIGHTTGNFWVNHTWSAGTGNVTDSYRVYVNGVWHNSTLVSYYKGTYSAHTWQNITVYAWNSSGIGTLSD